ncbi:MAG: HAMP domain-containing histidine kinase [Candidatus Zixiibacteriota bacterium]|nr:MAG: HAMP domain-containing histidine kinase [candidate division Zixibacteria bacterium]
MRLISKKLLVVGLFVVVLTILVNLSWWVFYGNTRRLLDEQLSERLATIARATRTQVTPVQISGLIDDDLDSYYAVVKTLEQIRSVDSLSELFILTPSYRYLATTSLDDDSLYMLRELNRVYIDSLTFGESSDPLVTPAYKTGDIYLKTAFIPLRDTSFFTAAILGVEASADYSSVLRDLRQNLHASAGLSLVIGLLLGLIFIFYQRRLGLVEQRLFLTETHAFLGRMVAVVSHEIKNPLMIIRATGERLKRRTDAGESQFIIEEVDRLNRIVTGYLDFARAGANRTSYLSHEAPEGIEIPTFISNLRGHLTAKYREQEIAWLGSKSDSKFSFIGYPRALRQVLLNLLINSVEACLAAGLPISIGLKAENRGTSVLLSVIDRGPGMSRKELARIGSPFYTTRRSGSGLGLYICRELVEEMKGGLKIESTESEGTTVTIELPVKIEN